MKYILTLMLGLGAGLLAAQVDSLGNPYAQLVSNSPRMQPSLRQFILNMDANVSPFIVSPQQLYNQINSKEAPVILDARNAAEFEISHLPKAKRVGFEDFTTERVWMIRRDLPIVIYCTTGDRSRLLAAYLAEAGFKNIKILDGAIIEWANEQLPLVNNQNLKTNQVHTYNKNNSVLLKKGKAIWN